MFHYFNTLTNTNGDSLVDYRVRALVNGVVQTIYGDENGTPIASLSGIANTALTDAEGNYSFYILDGTYDLQFLDGSGTPLKTIANVPMIGVGGTVATSLEALKATPVASDQMLYDGTPFKWTTGDYTGDDDDENIIESDHEPLSTGAWVRQGAASIQAAGGQTVQDVLDNRPPTYATLSAFKAGSISLANGYAVYDGVTFSWETANAPYTADDENIIKADSTSLSVGAWVRQAADSVTFQQSGSGAVTRNAQDKARDFVSVLDFGATGDGTTDDTAAIQAAVDAHPNVYFPRPSVKYMFTALTMPMRSRWFGDGPQRSILRQFASVDVGTPAVSLIGLNTANIADGARVFEDLGIEVKSNVGIDAAACTASMWRTRNLRLVQRINESLTTKPYPVTANTTGILLDADTNPAAIYLGSHDNLEIRSFETAVKALGPVNEQHFRGWFIDCKYGFDLDSVSRWWTDVAFESGVDNAIKYRFRSSVSSSDFWGRCEIPVAESSPGVPLSSTDHYLSEFIGSVTMTNVTIRDKPVLITQDGNGWPGRKYKGTLPDGVVYCVPFLVSGNLYDAAFGKATYTLYQGFPLYLGGASRGNGKITLGRNADDSTLFTIQHDGSQGVLDCSNGVMIAQTQGGSGWTKPFFIGAYGFWVDGSGRLRIKAGYPSSDTDGVVVGTQT